MYQYINALPHIIRHYDLENKIMAELHISGVKVAITDPMKDYAKSKFDKILESTSGQDVKINLNFTKNGNKTEAFKLSSEILYKGGSFYIEEKSDTGDDFYKLIDTLAIKTDRFLQKRKTKFESDKKHSLDKRDVSEQEEPEVE